VDHQMTLTDKAIVLGLYVVAVATLLGWLS
jgi:hypothetical protein